MAVKVSVELYGLTSVVELMKSPVRLAKKYPKWSNEPLVYI